MRLKMKELKCYVFCLCFGVAEVHNTFFFGNTGWRVGLGRYSLIQEVTRL